MKALGLPLALLALLIEFINALEVEVVVDDHDNSITYTGDNWFLFPECTSYPMPVNGPLLQNGTWHFVNGTNNQISFNFTGVAVSVRGVIPQEEWQGQKRPNITFDLDGLTTSILVTIMQDQREVLYNQTLFQTKDLDDGPHTLSIRTHNNSTFILDSITYISNTLMAEPADQSVITTSVPAESTFPYDQAGSPSGAPNTTLVGAIVGAIFGTFLLVGVLALFILRRSANTKRRKASTANRRGRAKGDPSRSKLSGGDGDPGRGHARKNRHEYKYSGPKQLPIPLGRPTECSKWQDPTRSVRAAIGTFVSRSSSDIRSMGGGSDYVHAITTDAPQPTTRMPMEWGQRAKADKHASFQSQGSTLEADGVLERMMIQSISSSHNRSPSSHDFDYSIPTLPHSHSPPVQTQPLPQQPQQPQQPPLPQPQPQPQHTYVIDHPFKASIAS